MTLEALAFLVELEIARKDGPRIGMTVKIAHLRTPCSAIPTSPPPSSMPAPPRPGRYHFRGDGHRLGEKRRAVLVPGRAVSMPSEGGGKQTIQARGSVLGAATK